MVSNSRENVYVSLTTGTSSGPPLYKRYGAYLRARPSFHSFGAIKRNERHYWGRTCEERRGKETTKVRRTTQAFQALPATLIASRIKCGSALLDSHTRLCIEYTYVCVFLYLKTNRPWTRLENIRIERQAAPSRGCYLFATRYLIAHSTYVRVYSCDRV